MLQTWLILSLAALLIWGSWGVFANLTTRYVDGFSALVWEVIGAMVVGAIILTWLFRSEGLEAGVRGATFGLLTGISYTVGLTFLFLALSSANNAETAGNSSQVHSIIVLTALYPVVSVALSYFFLSESVSFRQLAGMGLGLIGIAVLVTGR